ncbi:MAG TPA: ABC transporter ATP-binding protein [Roseiflexaceae bacterium]|nr:ABC transporter ATP-binding protein [Roseiflexaceae bacterium]
MQLTITNVSKRFGRDFWALRDYTVLLEPGVVGLLGPNGAGKSTLMRILATITAPTEGSVTWGGIDIVQQPDALRQTLGYLPQDFGVYPNLNAIEFLEYMAAIKGLDGRTAKRRIQELLELVNLTDAARRPVGGYSGGMRQRVGIAQALLNDPQLLIVDEPTAGLDPEERVRFRTLIADLSGDRIILLSTHIVSDIESTATAILIQNRGQLLAHAPPEQLVQAVEGRVWSWFIRSQDLPAVKQQFQISGTIRHSDGIQVRALSDYQPSPEAVVVPAALEDAYLYFVQQPAGYQPEAVGAPATLRQTAPIL